MWTGRLALAAAASLLLVGCTSKPSTSPGQAPTSPVPSAPSSPATSASRTISSTTSTTHATAPRNSSGVPRFAHIVVVVLENHAFDEIVGQHDAPYLNALAAAGAVLTQSYAVAHPSEPNYLALFAGSTLGLGDDSCPHTYGAPNLGSALRANGQSFVGYSEDLPSAGYTGCSSGAYARKHNPWVNFPALPASVNQPLTAFPRDLTKLPTVSFVIPNLDNDMHDGSVAQGDAWLRSHLGTYAGWAPTHNSLLIVTADEDDYSGVNQIPTILSGAHVRPGHYATRVDHYSVLRTILDSCGIAPFAKAAAATPITAVWSGS